MHTPRWNDTGLHELANSVRIVSSSSAWLFTISIATDQVAAIQRRCLNH
jgi:hypothetical protein